MIIECDSCSTKFRLDESKIAGHGVKVRCTKCENVFIVHAPEVEKDLSELQPVEQGGQGTPEPAPEERNDNNKNPVTEADEPAEDEDKEAGTEEPANERAGTERETETGATEKNPESKEERPSIGGLSFSLDPEENEQEEYSNGLGMNGPENDFLLDGFNRVHQGSDDIDLNDPEFNLLDDDEEADEDESDDFTFEIDTDDLTVDDTEDEDESHLKDEPKTSAVPSSGNEEELDETPPSTSEEPAAPTVIEEDDSEVRSAFEAVLKKASEDVITTGAERAEPETSTGISYEEETSLEEEREEERAQETLKPETTTGTDKPETTATEPPTGADADMRRLLNRALENVNDESTETPATEIPESLQTGDTAPASFASGDDTSAETAYETERDESGADAFAPPYEVDNRGSKSPLALAVLLIIAIGVLLYFTGIAGKVLNGNNGQVAELTVGITGVKSYVTNNREIGAVFVVEAQLLNMTDKPQEIAGVRGTLFNRSGKRLSVRNVTPGRLVSKEQLRDMSRQVLLKNFKDASGATIPPKGTVPVMLLFTNAPEATAEFALDVLR